ncbi:sulfite exporter TauE/SafE family protein [Candidatus Karelsulcia muelleri]|uniref:Sulfite exporter TauE/SafE family protein n=1 Tax=Candidatus Karelsulcia muelleri TaxID=336810 RepID=A0A3A1MML7_9FLAO|nr:sulfite exporter TauE/SafE family protein [Candidatus Karelsulcia muelleri]RIU86174.1 sulfite exporter TauE/SafE family protein [Candidatus Karelsulcia muelleri]
MEKLNYINIGFILGLISSIHCFSMCGPITFLISIDRENKMKILITNIIYQIGRIISYILLGFIFGTIGYGFSLAGFQKKISLFLGLNIIISFFFKKKISTKYILKKKKIHIL